MAEDDLKIGKRGAVRVPDFIVGEARLHQAHTGFLSALLAVAPLDDPVGDRRSIMQIQLYLDLIPVGLEGVYTHTKCLLISPVTSPRSINPCARHCRVKRPAPDYASAGLPHLQYLPAPVTEASHLALARAEDWEGYPIRILAVAARSAWTRHP